MILGHYTSSNKVTVLTLDRQYDIDASHPNFNLIRILVESEAPWEEIEHLFDIAKTINTATSGRVTIEDGEVLYNGQPLHNAVTTHLLRLYADGVPMARWFAFVESLMRNPSQRAREQLYGFMDAANISIDQNGNMLLYKKVKHDYYDVYTGRTFLNTVGSTISVERSAVDDDPTRTCSNGLNVAAHSYMAHYSGDRIVIVAVAPEDVVSIPVDYNNAKMRVCKYTVVAEHAEAFQKPTLTQSSYDTDEWDSQDDEDDDNSLCY